MNAIDLKTAARLVVVSGIPAGEGGTGQFVAHLSERMTELAGNRIRLIARPERPAPWRIIAATRGILLATKMWLRYALLWTRFRLALSLVFLRRGQGVLLLHPQNLGYRLTLRLLESRKHSSLLYLLDGSFFCVGSYNHVPGENESCLRCLEHGFEQLHKTGCKPFPRPDWTALEFAPRLQQLVRAGRVNVAAQNLRQAELAQRHFGLAQLPPVVGLWTQDFDQVFPMEAARRPAAAGTAYAWDVLFHGHCLDAKGASWLARVAALCPELRFMFPFGRPDWFAAPPNCSFVPCTWDSGLRAEIEKSRLVIVPSLWSAPIEGALVKSIAYADAVAVVNNRTSFGDEIPAGVVLKLSAEPSAAAEELRRACRDGWRPDAQARAQWLAEFAGKRSTFVPQLIRVALGPLQRPL